MRGILKTLVIIILTPLALCLGVYGCTMAHVAVIRHAAGATLDHVPPNCPDDGRLKGVRIGSAQFKATVYGLPEHACLTRGPNGTFLVTPDAVRKIAP